MSQTGVYNAGRRGAEGDKKAEIAVQLYSKRAFRRIFIGLVALIGAAVVVDGALAWQSEHRLASKVAELHAAGEPATLSDLAPKSVPVENNPAVYLERMWPDLQAFNKEDADFERSSLGEDYNKRRADTYDVPTSEEIKALRGMLDKYPAILPLLTKASQCTGYASPADFSLPSIKLNSQMLEQVHPYRSLMIFVEYKMQVLLADQKADEAVRLGIGLLKFADLRQEPFLWSYFLLMAGEETAFNVLNFAVRQRSLSAQVRAELEAELVRLDNLRPLRYALATERVFVLAQIDDANGNIQPIFFRWPLQNWRLNECGLLDQANEAAKLPLDEIRPRWDATTKRVHLPGELDRLTSEKFVGPAIGMSVDCEFRRLSLIRCLRVLNALEGYKQRTGKEAESVDQLSLPHEATIDPYSGKPLVVKKTEQGWVVYSVWRNNVDDGGRFNFNSGDWGFGPPGYPHERDPVAPPEKSHS